jgi:hypothetical protein
VIDVATAEAQAVRDGLRLAERIGCNRLYVETDALGVAEAFINSEQNRAVGLAFNDECRSILAGFDAARVHNCPREMNQAADVIAKSVEDRENSCWFDDPPPFLYPQRVDDVTVIEW